MSASKIRVLSDQTINKIAAGEVIENPASVVKELVENSLDAGASHICVEIQEGGRQLIRISDDGYGMLRDDALLCLERHATSKIREVEDIQDLLTMGFRGEALPSIAAISKFTLLTSPRIEGDKKQEGTFIVVEGGRLLSCASAARSPGTTIEVKSLFFNVPVRRKFQKSPAFDNQEILKMLGLLALAYPSVHFELISDQKSLLKTPITPSLLSFQELLGRRLECVLGKEYASSLIPLNFQQNSCDLLGYIGSPPAHKSNRTGQHLFINQRLVYSPFISAAVREGYGTMLPNHRHPIFVLYIRLPGSLLDVNVHPQKKEVRLRQEFDLKEMILQAVQIALRQQPQLNTLLSSQEKEAIPPYWAPYASLLSPNAKMPGATTEKWELMSNLPPSEPYQVMETPGTFKTNALELQRPSNSILVPISKNSISQNSTFEKKSIIPRVLTTLLGYSILDSFDLNHRLMNATSQKKEGGLLILDQRAAYARIYYEKLLKPSAKPETQALLIPLTLSLSITEFQALREYAPLLNQMGFELREFGEQTFVVDAFPIFLKQNDIQNCLNLLIQDLIEMHTSNRLHIHKEKQLAWAACRASIPHTKRLSLEESQGLVQQLIACEIPTQCPLGKPTCLYLSTEDLIKWFQKNLNCE